MLNHKPIPPKVRQFLRESQCGYDDQMPYVCCAHDEMTTASSATSTATSTATSSTSKEKPEWLKNLEAMLPKAPVCGLDHSNRIFGGTKTNLDEFPWMVLVEFKKREH